MSEKIQAMEYFKLAKGDTLTLADLEAYLTDMQNIFDVLPAQAETLKEVLTKPYDKVYAVGIGDSLYSAESVKLGFWKNSGIQMEVLESHEFNYYYADYMPANSLVLICSGGGSAARTVESSYLAQKRGATVVTVTITPKSRLLTASEHSLCVPAKKEAYIDGSRNYFALAAMMMILGIKLGGWNGTLSAQQQAEQYRQAMQDAKTGFETCINYDSLMRGLMEQVKDQDKFYFLGAGPSYIMTEYAAAKFMEQAAVDGIHQQLEEYGHEQYWVHNRNGKGDTIFSICPQGKSIPRCIENLREQKFLGLNTVVVTTPPVSGDLRKLCNLVIETPQPVSEENFWLVSGNVFARLANHYTAAIGRSEQMFASGEQFAEHYTTIHYSRFCPEVAEHDIPIPDEKTIQQMGAFGIQYDVPEK